ncbi:MAG: hypothetical protein KAW02_01075 [candidate division Zixibacteria bacterium]|nr:hypothetical protein [candidate division Zixibacteria bacterium]
MKQSNQIPFGEKVVTYALCKKCVEKGSKVFIRFSHNLTIKQDRDWDYWTGTDIDFLEITKERIIIGYEIKGMKKYKGRYEPSRLYEGLDQTMGYLNLPFVKQKGNSKLKFDGGAFDFVYLVHARNEVEFLECEKRIFDIVPIGFIIATPDGKFEIVKKASKNPIQSKEAKQHFLNNLDSLKKFSLKSKIFKKIQEIGKCYFKESRKSETKEI